MIGDPAFLALLVVGPLVHWLLPVHYRNAFLALLSAGYLGWKAPGSAAAVIGWTVAVVLAARWGAGTARPIRVTGGLILAVLGWMVAFKHVPVILDNLAGTSFERQVILPIGVSYYAFKLVHYVVEYGRGRFPEHTVADALAWTTLFPAFTAGPIERFEHFLSERETTFDPENLAAGFTRILHGLVKKLVLVDVIVLPLAGDVSALVADPGAVSPLAAWRFVLLMYLYAYLDFSAYSDIAIGASRLFGVRLMENFDWPVLATNLSTFWKRWHMTLAGWCQTYVYMPFVGVTRNPYAATMLTFLVMGLWHGAQGNWILWGLFHGFGVSTHLTWSRFKRKRKWHKIIDNHPLAPLGVVPTTLFVAAAASFTTTTAYGGLAGLKLFARLFALPVG